MSTLTQLNRESAARGHGPDEFFKLGMMCSTGQSMAIDMVAAHKWFNLAALRGVEEAKRWRAQISGEMDNGQIAEAQRLAREWLNIFR